MAHEPKLLARAIEYAPTMFLLGLALVAGIGFVDLETGPGFRIFPLYFIPISLGAWVARRTGAAFFAILSSATWAFSNWSWHSSDAHFAANVLTQLVAFGSVAALTASMRRNYDLAVETSMVDALTGLANTRGFYDRTQSLVELAARKGEALALVYLDLDDFKQVNDERGHAEGDDVLRELAKAMRACLRKTDIAARLGGDEFALVLVDGTRKATERAVTRLREGFAAATKERGWPVKLSVGALVLDPVAIGTRLVELMREADALMYEAKGEGKDTVVIRERDQRSSQMTGE